MSAFIVDDIHINAMVSYAIEHRIRFWNPTAKDSVEITTFNAEEIGRILLDENVRSVCHRYSDIENDVKDTAAGYVFKYFATPLTAVEALKACHCLDYQCCETDDWKTTLACRIVATIESHAARRVPSYDAAPWNITRDRAKQLANAGSVSLLSLARKQ